MDAAARRPGARRAVAAPDAAAPGGESWEEAVDRVRRFLHDLPLRWEGKRVLLIGHVATRFALDHVIGGLPLRVLCEAETRWQPGWEHRLET